MKIRRNAFYALLIAMALALAMLLIWPVGHSVPGGLQKELVRRDLTLIYGALEAYTGDGGDPFPDNLGFVTDIYRSDSSRVQRVLGGKYQLNPSLKGSTWRKIGANDWVASDGGSGQKILRSGEIVGR